MSWRAPLAAGCRWVDARCRNICSHAPRTATAALQCGSRASNLRAGLQVSSHLRQLMKLMSYVLRESKN